MRITITFPPISSSSQTPLLSQNRQFQWFSSPTYVYPVIPASAATLLNQNGHKVQWLDAIAQNLTYNQWFQKLKTFNPQLLFIETKTPVIKTHWQIIKNLKNKLPNCQLVLAGDHPTALPQESLQNSPLDFVITGGHYDISLLKLTNALQKPKPVKHFPAGLYYRSKNQIKHTTHFTKLKPNLNKLPRINRKLTQWQLYSRKNGNFKYTPGTYTMAGRDCWWRKDDGCTFCSWTTLFPKFTRRSPQNLLDEIGQLINLGVKEVFDDTGTFPPGPWLEEFCQGLIDRGYHKKITLGCNLRYGVLNEKQYRLLARSNFRLLLFGLESVNQETIDKLNKGTKPDQIESELKTIQTASQKESGQLQPHITCMVGYPWESYTDAQNTIQFTKDLFKKGLIDSLQATIIIPYPGTTLFQQAQQNNWLKTTNWDHYDMSRPVLKTPYSPEKLLRLVRSTYATALSPRFLLRKLTSIRSLADIKHLLTSAHKLLNHLKDFATSS